MLLNSFETKPANTTGLFYTEQTNHLRATDPGHDPPHTVSQLGGSTVTKLSPERNEQVGGSLPQSRSRGPEVTSSTTVHQQHLDTTLSLTNSDQEDKGITGLPPKLRTAGPRAGRSLGKDSRLAQRSRQEEEAQGGRRWFCRRGGPADGSAFCCGAEQRPPQRRPHPSPRTLSQPTAEGTPAREDGDGLVDGRPKACWPRWIPGDGRVLL